MRGIAAPAAAPFAIHVKVELIVATGYNEIMVARVRIILALLALFAFGSAEGARAMAFAPAEGTVAANCMSDMADKCAHGSHDGGDEGTSDCPSMPAGMTGMCTAIAVALHEVPSELRAVSSAQGLPQTSDDLAALMLARGLFHPPRA